MQRGARSQNSGNFEICKQKQKRVPARNKLIKQNDQLVFRRAFILRDQGRGD